MAIRSVFQRSGLNLDRFAKMARKYSLSNHCAHLDCGWSTSSLLCEGLIQSSRNKEEIKRPLSVTLKTHFRSEGQLRAFFLGEKSGENGTQIGIYFLRHTFSRGTLLLSLYSGFVYLKLGQKPPLEN